MKNHGCIKKTEIDWRGAFESVYPLMNPKYLNDNHLWDGEWAEKLPKTNKQTNLFDEL